MRARTAGATLAVVLLTLATGCTDDADGTASGYDPDTDASDYSHAPSVDSFNGGDRDDYREEATLPDGRKVRFWFAEDGSSLLEQHYSPREGAWTAPQTVFESGEPDPCQGIEIVEEGGIVAVVADFGVFCYDGDPPMESLAAVATGDLTEWSVDMTEGFDGWTRVTVGDEGARWTGSGESLAWTPDEGFSGGRTFDE